MTEKQQQYIRVLLENQASKIKLQVGFFSNFRKKVQKEIDAKLKEGYAELVMMKWLFWKLNILSTASEQMKTLINAIDWKIT
ncbi:hypothetical protein [Pedobacter sp. R-06]|uniref:hypothetical protein n=1 Tax=Pedobacter sp. R-06 TaxID=3404051 RepID=UPI003CF491D8